MFSGCSVGVFPYVDVFLMHLWEECGLHILLVCHIEGPPQDILDMPIFLGRQGR